MPRYGYLCECGAEFERYLRIENFDDPQSCSCGRIAQRRIFAPLMVTVSANVMYDSPIDGRPITSASARMEDLARNNCKPYDPGMKTDYENRLKREDAELDRRVDEVVDREVATMPAVKREKLFNEIAAGADANIVRSEVNG